VPRQQRGEIADHVIVDARQHVGEPGLRIDAVELGGLDQRVDDGGARAAAVGAGSSEATTIRSFSD
jgi:hypothetical protein